MKNKIPLFVFSFLVATLSFAQVQKSFTVIHCDPDDPTVADNWPEKTISTIGWNKLNQMVNYANSKSVNVTIEFTMPWISFILLDINKVNTIRTWQQNGNEIAAHHHVHSHRSEERRVGKECRL